MKLMVLDCETTGIEDDAKVVEIAGIPLTIEPGMTKFLRGAPVETLVHPGIPIPPTASAIHHITDADVRNAPSFEDAIHLFAGADVYVAHHAEFDRKHVGRLGDKWICTRKCAYVEWEDAPSYGNQALSCWLGTPRPPAGCGHAHRALYDDYTTLGIFELLHERGWTIDRMIEVSNKPLLLRSFDFGKHAGVPVRKVPRSYVEWMDRQPDWDPDVRHTINHILGRQ